MVEKPVEPARTADIASKEDGERDADHSARRRPNGDPKKLVTVRLDPDILETLKKDGDGWQRRLNTVLRTALGLNGESK